MFKKKILIVWMLCLLVLCTACSTHSSKAYTFKVNTGESVKIELDTSDGYDISSDVPFSISKDGITLGQGTFIKGEAYEQYVKTVKENKNAKLLDSGTNDGNKYIFWSYNGSEYDYAVLLPGGKTGIIIGNAVSEESARKCFERLSFTIEE